MAMTSQLEARSQNVASSKPSKSGGVPAPLNSRVEHLRSLLKGLPTSLPLDPPDSVSTYHFYLDNEDIEEEGITYAFNRRLEICFQTHLLQGRPLLLKERGKRYEALILMFKRVFKEAPNEQDFIQERWLDRIIKAAQASGAKVAAPPKRRRKDSSELEELSQLEVPKHSGASKKQLPRGRLPSKRARSGSAIEVSSDSEPEIQEVLQPQPNPTRLLQPVQPQAEPAQNLSTLSTPNLKLNVLELSDFPAPRSIPRSHHFAKGSSEPASPEAIDSESDVDFIATVDARSSQGVRGAGASRPCNADIPMKQATLFDFGAKHLSAEEVQDQKLRAVEDFLGKRGKILRGEERVSAFRRQRKLELGRKRQKRFRDRHQGGKAGKLPRPDDGAGQKEKLASLGYDTPCVATGTAKEVLAEVSRPDGVEWRAERNGKKKGVVQLRHKRMNWFHPFLWVGINRVAPKVAWSAALIAKTLKRTQPELYQTLNKGTVHKWLSKTKKGWSKRVLKCVEQRHALRGSGRCGILSPHPEIVAEIKKKMEDFRKSGIAINCLLARSIILAVIGKRQPELLQKFKCSESYVRRFLESVMGWSVRNGTRSAAKLPDDADEQCERALFRIVHLMVFYDIPLSLLVNMDQTGILLILARNTTYEKKGSRQVDIAGKGEKRAYTLCVASTPTGVMLPFQQVWSGTTKASLPTQNAPGLEEALEMGCHFAFAKSEKRTSHFSTLKTMAEWMHFILAPYIQSVIEAENLPADQKCILFIDCYPVHIGKEFRCFVLREFPNVFIIYVPTNCTGIFQPADVGIQRIIKHFIRQEYLEYLVRCHTAQVDEGLSPEDVKFTTSYPELRNASVLPMVNLLKYFQGPSGRDIIQRAWEKCTVREWNLGEACLSDRKIKAAYRDYLKKDETLRKEIEERMGDDFFMNVELVADEMVEDLDDDDWDASPLDGSEVPFTSVVRDTLDLDTITQGPSTQDGQFTIAQSGVHLQDNGGLFAGNYEEDIWAYGDDGKLLPTDALIH